MIKIEFTDSELDQLFEEKERNTHPRVRQKAEVVYLKGLDFSHTDIQRITRVSRPTLSTYLKNYKKDKLRSITDINFYRPESELDKYIPVLKTYFEEHPPASSNEAQMVIEQKTGIKRSPTQVREFLKRMGMKIRKVGYLPGRSCDQDKQDEQDKF